MTLSGLLDTLYRNVYTIVIGKAFTPSLVGYFNQAETMRKFPVKQLSTVMGKVTYPLFSNIKGDKQLKNAYKITMKLIFFVVVPVMMILIVSGKEFFLFLFGEKWLPAVPYFQILAIASITTPLSSYNLNILKVKGRSDLFLKLEVIKKSIGFLVVFAAVPFGMMTLVISYMVVSHISLFVNMFYSGKVIGYSLLEQLKDIGRIYFIGVFCLASSCLIKQLIINEIDNTLLVLTTLSISFTALYIVLIYLLEKNTITLLKKVLNK